MTTMRFTKIAFCILISLLLIKHSFCVEPVGTVRAVIDGVKVKSRDGEERSVKIGDPVYRNDTVTTEKDGKVKILFNNDNILILGFSSNLTINESVYDEKTKDSKSIFTLISGKIRAIVKKLFTPNSQFKIKTANSDIGVLGTDFIVTYKNNIVEVFVEFGDIQIDNPNKLWSTITLRKDFFTKIEDTSPPVEPKLFEKDKFGPVRNELTIYEDIEPLTQDDYENYMETQKEPAEAEVEEREPLTEKGPITVPPIEQEPLTGTVKVLVTTEFP